MKFVEDKSMQDLISYARWESRDEEARINATNLSALLIVEDVDILEIENRVEAVYRPYITYDDVVDMFSDNSTVIPQSIGFANWDEVWEEVESRRGRK